MRRPSSRTNSSRATRFSIAARWAISRASITRRQAMAEKIVLITGATGNLGKAVAAAFEAEGARLVLIGSRPESLDRAYPDQSERHLKLAADLTDAEAATYVVAEAERVCGRIDA